MRGILARRVVLGAGTLALALSLAAWGPVGRVHAEEGPVIAAAASLRGAVDEIAELFAKKTGSKVRLSYGATGNLVRQIEEGAPFELFLAADQASVAKLVAGGKTDGEGSLLVRGRLVIAAPKGSPVSVDGNLEGLKAALKAGTVRHISIANPELAPYGRAAREALQHAGLWTDAEKLLVLGENVGQAAQFITTGAAEAGLVAQSVTVAPEFAAAATTAVVPEGWFKPIEQGMVLLKGAGDVARAFHAYLKEAEARAVFEKNGFTVP
jgi:molybdate transport system substrate-binding protein